MKMNTRFLPFKAYLPFSAVFIALFAFLCIASAQARAPMPLIAPIDTKPAGRTYGRWAAEWWQWALGVPGAAPRAEIIRADSYKSIIAAGIAESDLVDGSI
jgi:hypothetical protein